MISGHHLEEEREQDDQLAPDQVTLQLWQQGQIEQHQASHRPQTEAFLFAVL
jgi:hypothetical protein